MADDPRFVWPGAESRYSPVGTRAIGGTTTTPFANVSNAGGRWGGALASAIPVPGAGLIGGAFGTGFDVNRANSQLEQLGLPRSVSFGPAAFNNASFGMFGNSARGQFEQAVTKAYPGLLQALTPAPAPVTYEREPSTPSMDYFTAINDLNNVGRLGDVLGAPSSAGDAGGHAADTVAGAYEGSSLGGDPDRDASMYRHGGRIPHDGDGRLEAVPVTAHEGEFVVRPEAVAKYGAAAMEKINAGKVSPKALAKALRK